MLYSLRSRQAGLAIRTLIISVFTIALLTTFTLQQPAANAAHTKQIQPQQSSQPGLAEWLTHDGKLKPGFRGSADARGHRLKFGARGEPRFVANTAFCTDKWQGSNEGFPGTNDFVYALAAIGSDLYVGGSFSQVNGITVNGIAKWNGSSWSALSGGLSGGSAAVYALAVNGSDLYAGGDFTAAGGVSANRIAKWNGANWSALGSGLDDLALAITAIGPDVYVGGAFIHAGGTTVNFIAKWNGTTWSGLANGMNDWVWSLAAQGSNLFAGGYFSSSNSGVTVDHIAKWNGSSWSALGNGFNDTVLTLAADSTNLYAGGDFSTDSTFTTTFNHTAKWNGSSWSALGTGTSGTVWSFAVAGSEVYAGGSFPNAGGNSVNYIAKWNGSAWSALSTGMDADVYALRLNDTGLYAAGGFLSAGCVSAQFVAKYDLSCAASANGNWSSSSTWSCGHVPTNSDAAVIQSGQNITLDTNPTTRVIVNSGGTLTVSSLTPPAASYDIICNGALVLNSDLNMGANTLTLGSSSTGSGSGDVLGRTFRNGLSNGTTYFFGNTDNRITFNSGTPPANFTLYLQKGTPAFTSNGPNRTLQLTPVGGSGYSATVRLRYLQTEVGTSSESNYSLFRYNGSSWDQQTNNIGSPDTTNNWVEVVNVTGFSPWLIGVSAPLAVQLASFNAKSSPRGVALDWRTGYEADNLGFNLYRETAGTRVKLNAALIAGSALLTGKQTILRAGSGYAWTDAGGTSSARYWLEDIDLKGKSVWHGPINVSGTAAVAQTAFKQARSLNELNDAEANTAEREWAAEAENTVENTLENAKDSDLLLSRTEAAAATQSWLLPNQDAVKLCVRQTGWYRVTQAQLAATGFNTNVNPNFLQMFADGVEVPLKVNGKGNNGFDTVEFYGRGLDLPSTDTHVYWLIVGDPRAQRIDTASPKAPTSFNATSFRSTVERKDRLIYFSGLLNGDAENWFGPIITPDGATQKLTTRFVDRTAMASLELTLQGVTDQTHAVNIQVNGRNLAIFNFTGRAHPTQQFNVPGDWLVDGENEIKLISTAGASDYSLADCARLNYTRGYRTDNNTLNFTLGAGLSALVGGFTTPNVRVLQLNANGASREVTVKTQLVNGSYSFALTGDGTAYLAVTDNLLQPVAMLKRNQPSNWRAATNAADFVIVTHGDFMNAAQKLAAVRRTEGLAVAVVDVEDAYDEFAFGTHTPQAIKDLLSNARQTWARKPDYALLLGDATHDPRNYLGVGNPDFVPTKLGATYFFETALDNWFADANNDTIPELALGRLPVNSAAQADAVVNKILANKPGSAPRAALLASDRIVEGYDFKTLSTQLATLLPADWPKQFINRDDGTPDYVRNQIVQTINGQSPLVVNWFGHGSVQVWTGDGLLRVQDAPSLTNAAAGLFVMATCLNGYFTDPQQASLGEAVLTTTSGGAFAVVSSTALNEADPQLFFAQTFYRSLMTGMTLGQAMTAGRLSMGDPDVRNSYVLFGDPTQPLLKRK